MSDDKILDLLVGGREYFATHEWNRDGSYFDETRSCVCAVGALKVAAGDEGAYGCAPLVSEAWDELEDQLGGCSVTYFNDKVAESKDDVLAVFDRAIEARKSAVSA